MNIFQTRRKKILAEEKFEFRTNPLTVRFSRNKTTYKSRESFSTLWQITLAEEVRKVFGITEENADTVRIVYVIRGDGTVALECLRDQPPRKKWERK